MKSRKWKEELEGEGGIEVGEAGGASFRKGEKVNNKRRLAAGGRGAASLLRSITTRQKTEKIPMHGIQEGARGLFRLRLHHHANGG